MLHINTIPHQDTESTSPALTLTTEVTAIYSANILVCDFNPVEFDREANALPHKVTETAIYVRMIKN